MRKYLTAYLKQIEQRLQDPAVCETLDYAALMEEHLHKIAFMQHERLIHFLVTMLFALGLLLVMSVFLITQALVLLPLLFLILVLLIPYIMHYYFLENAVQNMYRIYDELCRRQRAHEKLLRNAAAEA